VRIIKIGDEQTFCGFGGEGEETSTDFRVKGVVSVK
jgi:hypothetical protein